MYTIADYGAMIADAARMGAFARALGQAIKPGAVVIDIGTGTGICALLACRHGARRVYAIEPTMRSRSRERLQRRTGTPIGSSSFRPSPPRSRCLSGPT